MSDVSFGSRQGQREQHRMKERCQAEVAFSLGQAHKCQLVLPAPLSTFSPFNPTNLILKWLLPLHLFLAFLHLLRAKPAVILLSAMRDGLGTHGDAYRGISGQQEDSQDKGACVRAWA